MTTTETTPSTRAVAGRCIHRTTCILAGVVALAGVTLTLLIHPWFAALVCAGGAWLILAPDSKGFHG